ncbi:Trigger factor [Desulfovibrio sp. X2]|uniref:trigger factor n=1 Tax=Desulfovibrio sp. X2 TaxID=941449 RepID=UPI0003588223|nr:trigger factor [Desulfovibrio sp. X2]EPR37600.1 Trigger factor [Desulfovibrio sp. X2]
MEYKVEDLSPVEKKITVSVSAEEVNAALAATTAIYTRTTEMKGFRKGKVPMSVVGTKYKKQILAEATQDLVNYQLNEIMSELKLSPVSGINVDPAGEMAKDEDYSYTFSFEVPPALDLPQYRGRKVEQESVVVDEAEVDQVIERIRGNLAELKDVEEKRKAQDGDVVVIDFAAMGQDKAFEGLRAQNFQLDLGKGQALESFEELVKTVESGEKTQGQITFPDDFLNTDLAGKTVEMHVHLKSIKEKVLPPADDELAKKAGGYETYDALRGAIRNSYEASRTQLNRSVAEKKLLDDIIEGMEIPLPPSLVDRTVSNLLSEHIGRLERKGKSLESTGKTVEQLREEYKETAEQASRVQVFLMAVANKEGLTVSPQEVEAEIRKVAAQSGQDFESIKQYYEQTGMHVLVKDRLLADKAMELIYEAAEVAEVAPKAPEAEKAESGESA